METVSSHYKEVLDNLSESLREQRRARFLLQLAEDDGYNVPTVLVPEIPEQ
jgi:hypothetical protein